MIQRKRISKGVNVQRKAKSGFWVVEKTIFSKLDTEVFIFHLIFIFSFHQTLFRSVRTYYYFLGKVRNEHRYLSYQKDFPMILNFHMVINFFFFFRMYPNDGYGAAQLLTPTNAFHCLNWK